MDGLHVRDPGHNPTSNELLLERSVAKESEPCSTELKQSRIQKNSCGVVLNSDESSVLFKRSYPVGERKWNDIPAFDSFKGDSLSAEISKLVMRLVRRNDQDEREIDGAVHWNSMVPKLRRAF